MGCFVHNAHGGSARIVTSAPEHRWNDHDTLPLPYAQLRATDLEILHLAEGRRVLWLRLRSDRTPGYYDRLYALQLVNLTG